MSEPKNDKFDFKKIFFTEQDYDDAGFSDVESDLPDADFETEYNNGTTDDYSEFADTVVVPKKAIEEALEKKEEPKKKLTKEEKRVLREERLIKKYEEELERKKNHKKMTFKDFLGIIFPKKGDSVFDIVRKVLLIVCVITFIVSGIMFADYMVKSAKNGQTTDSIKELKGKVVDLSGVDFPEGANAADFGALYATNPDTVGWIYVPNTKIDNVVVQGQDNEFYRTHDFYGKNSEHGTVLLDCRANVSVAGNSRNLVMYGHHMMDDSMFATLTKYRTFSFYQENPIIYFDTLFEKGQYEVFSVMITNENAEQDGGYRFEFDRVNFGDDDEFSQFITQVQRRSIYKTNVTVSPDDSIITLSTCVYDFTEARLVVVARKLRTGEEAANTSTAVRNPAPLYPQAWYDKKGGSKPNFGDETNQNFNTSSDAVTSNTSGVSSNASDLSSLPSIPTQSDLSSTASTGSNTESTTTSGETSGDTSSGEAPPTSSENPGDTSSDTPSDTPSSTYSRRRGV